MTIAALALATSCGKSDTPTAASEPVDVRLVVSSGDNTRVGSDKTDNDISQLRVYAFNAKGKRSDMPRRTISKARTTYP